MMKVAVLAATAIVKPSVESMCRRPLAKQRSSWTKNRLAPVSDGRADVCSHDVEAPLRGALGRAVAEEGLR